jgi:hypothetical protein
LLTVGKATEDSGLDKTIVVFSAFQHGSRPCRPFAKAALASGVAQTQAILDPLQPAFDPVDATRLASEVAV